jgi:hypothetical protein
MSVIEIRYFQDKTVKWINVCRPYVDFGSLMAPKFFQSMVVEDLTKKEDQRNRIYESMHALDWVKM